MKTAAKPLIIGPRLLRAFKATFARCTATDRGCLLWPGGKTKRGYGTTGRRYLAHRVSFAIHKGAIPTGRLVCHSCDNPSCVNPDHLFLGTDAENSADMVKKGRSASRDRHSQAKLTTASATAIRREAADGVPRKELAARYGVSKSTVRSVIVGELWGT
jgi:hypothetical protein